MTAFYYSYYSMGYFIIILSYLMSQAKITIINQPFMKSRDKQQLNSPTIKPKNTVQISQIFSQHISLKLLQFLQMHMQPHHKYFNIIQIAEIINQYLDIYILKTSKPNETYQQYQDIRSTQIGSQFVMSRKLSQNKMDVVFELKKEQYFNILMQQMRKIFLYFAKLKLSYELINEYVYNEQLIILSTKEKDEQYFQNGQKRIHLDDQNIKICLMPLIQTHKEYSTKVVDLIFRQNQNGSELQSIYSVTKQFLRCIRLKPELIGIAADYDKKGGSQSKCWYYYQDDIIMPRQSTIDNNINIQNKILVKQQQKMSKLNPKKKIQDLFSPQLLQILKAQIGKNVIGMITLDQSFIIQPIMNNLQDKTNQGYIGNLNKDVPPIISIYSSFKEKYQDIFLFHHYIDHQWIVATQKFIYFYRLPLPSQNIILKDQNNSFKNSKYQENPLLLMCQRMPKGSTKVMALKKPFLAIMLQRNTILIIKMSINNKGIFEGRKLLNEDNYYTITNKIYNDIQYKCMNYNPTLNYMFLSDFGAYLIRIKFNQMHGDIQQQGIIHNRFENNELNREMLRNSYSQLKLTKIKSQNGIIHQMEQEEEQNLSQPYISIHYIKKNTNKYRNHLISMYKKSNKSPHTIIIKNQNRQLISYITSNAHYNTLVTYQSQSVEKKTSGQFEGQKYRQWTNKNEIKLWDMKHMTIYQNVKASIEISFLQLRSNGLYAVTSQKGYVAFYPFNQDKKILIDKAQQLQLDKQNRQILEQLSDDLILDNNTLYFSTLISSYNRFNNLKINKTNIYQMQLQKYPITNLIQTLPSEIASLDINSRIYVLQNSTKGIEASQVHIYNKMGIKEEVIIFSNHEDIDMSSGKIVKENFNQQYKYLKRIDHQQFQVVLWNSDSYKLVGTTHDQSFTVIFNFSRLINIAEYEKTNHIRNIEINNKLMIIYCQTITKIKDKSLSTVSISSKHSQNSQSTPDRRRHKTHQYSQYSIIIVNNQIDRIMVKMINISPKIKVLHLYHTLLITKEESNKYEIIRILDSGQSGDLGNKILYSVKYAKVKEERIKKQDLKNSQFYDLILQKNVIIQEIKQFIIRKSIMLQQSKIAINQSNKLILILIFKLQTQYIDFSTKRNIKNEVQFLFYVRNISNELNNQHYKISKFKVQRKNNKNLYEYDAKHHRVQNIIGHQKTTYQQLSHKSNFMQIDIQKLTQLITGDQAQKFPIIDITNILLMPHKISNNRIKDIYKILSLQNDKQWFNIYNNSRNKVNALTNFSFKIIQYNEDILNGIIAISNKTLRTISLHTFKIACQIQEADLQKDTQAPFRLTMQMEKLSLFQVKSINEIQNFQKNKVQNLQMRYKSFDHIQLYEWNRNFKSRVDEIWQETFSKIKLFIKEQKNNALNKNKIHLPPLQLKISAVKIKKQEILKRKLAINDQSNNYDKNNRYIEQQPIAKPQGVNLMFKKWSINQSIQSQRKEANKFISNEARNVNRYINKILAQDNEKEERINSLICNVQKIKEITKLQRSVSKEKEDKIIPKYVNVNFSANQSQSYTNRSLSCPIQRLDNIIKITELTKEANLKSYMIKKYNMKTQGDQSNNPFIATRTQVNRTKTDNYDQLSRQITAIDKNDIRNTNLSKNSNYSQGTNLSKLNKKTQFKQSSNTLQQKLQKKIRQISQQKNTLIYSPIMQQTQKNGILNQNKSRNTRMKTLQNSTDNNSQLSKYSTPFRNDSSSKKYNKFHPQINGFSAPSKKTSQSQFKKPKIQSDIKLTASQFGRNDTMISNTDILDIRKRVKTQMDKEKIYDNYALQALKRSQNLMKDIFLPEINKGKERLMTKMKQKVSYIKFVHNHINDSRDQQQRKQLKRKLTQYK